MLSWSSVHIHYICMLTQKTQDAEPMLLNPYNAELFLFKPWRLKSFSY